jgi:hypothetical protein
MVPMPSRGSARRAWTGRGTLKSSPAVRSGAVLPVEPTRAPLEIAQPFMAGIRGPQFSKSRQGRKNFSAVPRGTFTFD